ncbi:Protein cps3 [Mycena sanguinolenta]|uniref:Protein cps3 n=1 Tax=Mycena sanguinolenta TaxID=230812 RepID=A0A8H6XI22_9AGAR|nr:Protein cps3 [Mycena sanguinolenta]
MAGSPHYSYSVVSNGALSGIAHDKPPSIGLLSDRTTGAQGSGILPVTSPSPPFFNAQYVASGGTFKLHKECRYETGLDSDEDPSFPGGSSWRENVPSVIITCTNCRRRKYKCKTDASSPESPFHKRRAKSAPQRATASHYSLPQPVVNVPRSIIVPAPSSPPQAFAENSWQFPLSNNQDAHRTSQETFSSSLESESISPSPHQTSRGQRSSLPSLSRLEPLPSRADVSTPSGSSLTHGQPATEQYDSDAPFPQHFLSPRPSPSAGDIDLAPSISPRTQPASETSEMDSTPNPWHEPAQKYFPRPEPYADPAPNTSSRTQPVSGNFGGPLAPPRGRRNVSSGDQKASSKTQNDVSDLQHVPCKFFKVGLCTTGSFCPFSHSPIEPSGQKDVCAWFVNGHCRFGHKCTLAHVLPGEAMMMDYENKKAIEIAADGENSRKQEGGRGGNERDGGPVRDSDSRTSWHGGGTTGSAHLGKLSADFDGEGFVSHKYGVPDLGDGQPRTLVDSFTTNDLTGVQGHLGLRGLVSVHDSEEAASWVENHWDDDLLTTFQNDGWSGPVSCMLSPEEPALAIFGSYENPRIVDMAQSLAEVSGFPVIIRPACDNPVLTLSSGDINSHVESNGKNDERESENPGESSGDGSSEGSSGGAGDCSSGGDPDEQQPNGDGVAPGTGGEGGAGGGAVVMRSRGRAEVVTHTT